MEGRHIEWLNVEWYWRENRISAVRQSPALFRELRRALPANEKRAIILRKAGGSARAPARRQEIEEGQPTGLAFLRRTCLASTCS
jgi:hypothetical protein